MKSLWMLVAGFSFACMGVFVKMGSAHFSSIELVFYRSLVGLSFIFIFVRVQRLSVRTPFLRLHISRAFFTMLSLVLYFYALAELSVPIAVTLNNTAPLFLIPFVWFALKERPNHLQVLGIFIGFVGILLLVRPNVYSSNVTALVIGLGAGLLHAVSLVGVRRLGTLNEPEWKLVFYLTLFCTLVTGAWLATTSLSPVNAANAPILLGIGVTATAGQLALSRAYKTGRTLFVAGLSYTNVVFASILVAVLWGETLPLREWLAFVVISLGGVFASAKQTKVPITARG